MSRPSSSSEDHSNQSAQYWRDMALRSVSQLKAMADIGVISTDQLSGFMSEISESLE